MWSIPLHPRIPSSMYLKEFSLTLDTNDDISKINVCTSKSADAREPAALSALWILDFFSDARTLVKMSKSHLSYSVLFIYISKNFLRLSDLIRAFFFILRSNVTASSDDENDIILLFYRSRSFESRDPYATRINCALCTFLRGGTLLFFPWTRTHRFFQKKLKRKTVW